MAPPGHMMALIAFLAAAATLWALVFGYVGALLALAWRRRRAPRPIADDELPRVALVIPVRDEEAFIARKLANLAELDYPRERLTPIVVDGGSTDATLDLVDAARAAGTAVEVVRVDRAAGKCGQLNAVLGTLTGVDVIVVTDADALLDPACIRHLVAALAADPATAVVGARIRPATRLLEERLHWWIVNSLWWLEGEAFGAAGISGVCYALRPDAVRSLPADCTAEDIHLALAAHARGQRVRLARAAIATELRVPQTIREFLRFRRRRGLGYLRELRRRPPAAPPPAWYAVRWIRLAQFFLTPVLAAAALASGAALCLGGEWRWLLLLTAAFAVPATTAAAVSTTLGGPNRGWWRLGLAAGRLAGLTWLVLVVVPRPARPTAVQGE